MRFYLEAKPELGILFLVETLIINDNVFIHFISIRIKTFCEHPSISSAVDGNTKY